jgi:hypothetical protein
LVLLVRRRITTFFPPLRPRPFMRQLNRTAEIHSVPMPLRAGWTNSRKEPKNPRMPVIAYKLNISPLTPPGKIRPMRMVIWLAMAVIGIVVPIEAADSRLNTNSEGNVVINNLNALPDARMAIYFDCGVNDFFLEVNRALHQKMNEMKITHSYDEFPGGHTQDYWGRSLPKHVEFFSKYLATGK